MPTLLNGCLCSRIEAPGYVAALDELASVIGGWAYMRTYCQGQVACRVQDEVYMIATVSLFNRCHELKLEKRLLRALLGGKSPFASRVIAASVWFSNVDTSLMRLRLVDMRGDYKTRKRSAVEWKWTESKPVSVYSKSL